jgi:hypothetical protein
MRLVTYGVLSMVLLACEAHAGSGATCGRSSDCAAPLVCGFGRCRAECRASRDCPPGSRCVAVGAGAACTLEAENHCDTSVCPSPLLCVSDQCRTVCTGATECVAGSCTMGTCDEPASPVPDAGAVDAATDAGPIACAFDVAPAVHLVATTLVDHLSITTSETSDASGPVGWMHVGAMGTLDAGPTAFVVTLPVAHPDATPVVTDLSTEAFFLVGPRSIALQRSTRGEIDVFAIFAGTSDTIAGSILGGVGHIQAGAAPWPDGHVARWGGWFCAMSNGTGGCVDPPTTAGVMRGRALVVGGGSAADPTRMVYRYQQGAMPMQLASTDEAFAPPDHQTTAPSSATFTELAGSNGRWVALVDTAAGSVSLWDTTTDAAPMTFMRQPPAHRAALAFLGSDRYALAFDDNSGAIDAYGATCAGTCVVTAMASQEHAETPSGASSYVLPAMTHTPNGIVALAYVERGAGQADLVHLVLLSDTLAPKEWSRTVVYTASASDRDVMDVQLYAVRDGADYAIAIAVLEGPRGTPDAQALWVARATAPSSCFF